MRRALHTLAASARAKMDLARRQCRLGLQRRQLLRGNLERAATISMCRPCASRAFAQHVSSRQVRAVAATSGTAAEAPNSLARSIIEIPALVRNCLPRLGEAPLELARKLGDRLLIVELALDLDTEPERFGARRRAVVDPLDVELRPRPAPPRQKRGQVEADDRVGGVDLRLGSGCARPPRAAQP